MSARWPLLLVLTLTARVAVAQTKADSAAVRATARDYLVAWYDANPTLMEEVLHPDLAKRNIAVDTSGRSRFAHMGAMAMVRATRRRSAQPANQRLLEVTLFELTPTAATAKVVSWDFIDYIHLAKSDGRWVIVNDLWIGRPR